MIRRLTYLDIPRIEFLMRLHWEETDTPSRLPYDREQCIASLCHYIRDPSHVLLGYERDGAIIGYMWFFVCTPHYSKDYYANECYLFVHPAWRKSGLVLNALLNGAKAASASLGCKFLQVGTLGGIERQEAAYNKRFLKLGLIYNIPLENYHGD